jgi:hypothetical protein
MDSSFNSRPGAGSLVEDQRARRPGVAPGKRTLTEQLVQPAAVPASAEQRTRGSSDDVAEPQGIGLPEGVDSAPTAGVLVSHGLTSSRFASIDILQQVVAGALLIRKGSSHGDAVAAIQAALEALGFPCGGPDGAFGSNTEGAIRRFQTASNLAPDGVVGPETISALDQRDTGIGQAAPANPANQEDMRLGHNTKVINGKNWDPERNSTIFEPQLPFLDGGGWDHSLILSRWSQEDNEQDVTITDDVRCSVNAAMAVRIVAGPHAVADFARAAETEADRVKTNPSTTAVQKNNIDLMRATLAFPISEIEASIRTFQTPPLFGERFAFAGYHTLDIIANSVKVMLTANPRGLASIGMSDTNPNPTPEAENIFTLGTGASRQPGLPIRIQSRGHMQTFVAALRPGEAWLLAIDLHQGNPQQNRTDFKVAELNHGITVGREPLDKGGRVYLYDPAPKTGSQIFFVQSLTDGASEVGFWPYFEVPRELTGGASVFKHTEVLQATMAL